MNGLMKQGLVGLCLLNGLASVGCWGGEHYRNLVDPCQQERYAAAARQEVLQSFGPQVENGHILDQTIWNYHFEQGTDKLHPGGMAKLDQLVQTRPQPDPKIFLATARDLTYRGEESDKFSEARRDLNNRRIVAIQRYLASQTADRPMAFEVYVHDPAPTGIPAISASTAIARQRLNYQGTLGSGAAGAGVVPGGATGGGQQGQGQGGTGTGGGAVPAQPATQPQGGAPSTGAPSASGPNM